MADVTPEQLQQATDDGRAAATSTLNAAPDHPLLRVAWARGFGQTDQLQAAVDLARAGGFTWREIGEAVGENQRTVETKYGGGRERQRRYQQRRRSSG